MSRADTVSRGRVASRKLAIPLLVIGVAVLSCPCMCASQEAGQVVDISRPIDRPKIYPAGSRRLQGETTLPLLCAGDAAMCYDPVSGQGIIKALRSGIFAAFAIGDFLRNGDVRGLRRYRLMLDREFVTYEEALRGYYTQERRWPNRPFWRRRTATPAPSCDKTLEQQDLSNARESQKQL